MQLQRPDLSDISPAIRLYIEALEAEVERLRPRRRKHTTRVQEPVFEPILEPNEEPTTMGMITLSASGVAKRTLRHLYSRQRRGGMVVGVHVAPCRRLACCFGERAGSASPAGCARNQRPCAPRR